MQTIIPHTTTTDKLATYPTTPPTYDWINYFNPAQAIEQLINHIEALPGSRHERHTMRAYLSALSDFLRFSGAHTTRHGAEDYTYNFANMQMPTKPLIIAYHAHCKRRDLSAKTITRYMASIKLFIRALEEQQVIPRSGPDFIFITEAQRQLRLAANTKNPRPDTTSNRPALEQHGRRLNIHEVNKLLTSFNPGVCDLPDITTISGKRDLAILYIGITTGLRASEIARLTLSSIRPGDKCHEIHIRGKRNNTDPVGIDDTAHNLITDYITAFNEALPTDDPRRISSDTPLFQPLLRGDNIPPLGLRNNATNRGLAPRAILSIISRRSDSALGFKITAHDMRRTCAYLMRSHGYEWDVIRAQLRHKSIGTTEKYVGREQDLSKALLSNSADFELPTDSRLKITVR